MEDGSKDDDGNCEMTEELVTVVTVEGGGGSGRLGGGAKPGLGTAV